MPVRRTAKSRADATPETGLVWKSVNAVYPSPENSELYRPVVEDDPEVIALAESIRERGILEPLLLTEDDYIISGHRRHLAARMAGKDQVPCRVHQGVYHNDDEFLQMLREANRQREKTNEERLREEIVSVNPESAYASLRSFRAERSEVHVPAMRLNGVKRRSGISEAKIPMLEAVRQVLDERANYLPINLRAIHYALLNNPPLRHASKPDSRYCNDRKSYQDLSDLLTRARLDREIPMEWIEDETRPVKVWNTHSTVRRFIRHELKRMFNNYWRDLQQGQPNHIEVLAEKLTVQRIVSPICANYTIPLTIGRGNASLPPRAAMVRRYRLSRRDKLIVIALGDFDADGESIVESFLRSLRDDFDMTSRSLVGIKAGLTYEQTQSLDLPDSLEPKQSSSNYSKFVERYGDDVGAYELEAVTPDQLQSLLDEAIRSVLDIDAFNAEVEQERKDAQFLQGVRNRLLKALPNIGDDDAE